MKPLLRFIFGLTSRPTPKPLLPLSNLADLVPGFKPRITNLEPHTATGNVTIFELFAINFITAALDPKRLCDIGTFDGRTTLNLAANCPPDSRIVTLDLPAEKLADTRFALEDYDKSLVAKPSSGERFNGRPEAAKLTQVFGDSGYYDFTPFNNSFDLVFVDGSHAYEYVINDSRIALNLLRNKKGAIIWHDYDNPRWPGVLKGLDELMRTDEFKGIKHIANTTLAFKIFE